MNTLSVETPNYVLLDEDHQRIGPSLLPIHPSGECVAVYGFTDKQPYDAYCSHTKEELTPYPLVKCFLQDQLALPGNVVRLIVIDPVDQSETPLRAATMSAVLTALEKRSDHVTLSHRLIWCEPSRAYRVEAISSGAAKH
ncbi:hypothetical protein [Stieleria varia]|uniref:Uncharacterized protein n=1 Tax=Stieleria varia TaxID=2528005 RepID=A0A5C6A3F7_9BACT|nr:hypothetical protein [Stieleria varia]TWT93905.1 hypothetical protein Pla52n_57330 [Stieleria varia]